MKTIACRTVIAGGNSVFRSRLKGILKMAEKESGDFSIIATDTPTMDELEKEINDHTDIAFIDSSFVVKESGRLARVWKKTKSECTFTLLLSDSNAAELKEVIYEMEKQKSLPLNVHVLKNNYPDELILHVIMRMIKLTHIEKNMAVV